MSSDLELQLGRFGLDCWNGLPVGGFRFGPPLSS